MLSSTISVCSFSSAGPFQLINKPYCALNFFMILKLVTHYGRKKADFNLDQHHQATSKPLQVFDFFKILKLLTHCDKKKADFALL